MGAFQSERFSLPSLPSFFPNLNEMLFGNLSEHDHIHPNNLNL